MYDEAGHQVTTQVISGGTTEARLVAMVDLRPQAFMQLNAGESKAAITSDAASLSAVGPGLAPAWTIWFWK
ncbi:hypothetical protein MASR2M78_20320 [Treponema sp.]